MYCPKMHALVNSLMQVDRTDLEEVHEQVRPTPNRQTVRQRRALREMVEREVDVID